MRIFCGIMSVPQNIIMTSNNVIYTDVPSFPLLNGNAPQATIAMANQVPLTMRVSLGRWSRQPTWFGGQR